MSQVGSLLKSDHPSNPLKRYDVERAYATSETGGGLLPLYINTIGPIAKTADGEPVYDAYLIEASGSPGRINQCEPAPPPTHPIAASQSAEPVIRLFSHSDVIRGSAIHSGSTCDFRRADSDDVLPYRHYEIAGAHVAALHKTLVVPNADDGARAGGTPIPPLEVPPNEFPTRYIMNGAFENLDRWVGKGVAPPRAPFLEATDDCTELIVDEFGTPRGGVRTPYVDVPINTYPPVVSADLAEGNPIPFEPELVRELYRTHGNYVRLVTLDTIELIKDRWVTPDDGLRIILEAARSDVLKGRK